ncbi:helix-turn-helix domain-containing protein [Paenibacillus sp. tmac-D7]|uniref:helix-turn-helix domain-containing protein n=1 Tax=Paenibacillus sp. tmac-D7 TaxID=2591462 RepID=UPI001143599E|nr:helix-turn-helix transcriptional regulator [Paenibacillus sp. tmac-D7]
MSIELSFAKILKTLRINNKLSQEELAFRSDLDRTYISMLERGIHQPTISTLFALSKALNIKASEMIKLVEIDCENDYESNQQN